MNQENLSLMIGTLVVANIGAIGGGIVWALKTVWWASDVSTRLREIEKDVHNLALKLNCERALAEEKELEKKIEERKARLSGKV